MVPVKATATPVVSGLNREACNRQRPEEEHQGDAGDHQPFGGRPLARCRSSGRGHRRVTRRRRLQVARPGPSEMPTGCPARSSQRHPAQLQTRRPACRRRREGCSGWFASPLHSRPENAQPGPPFRSRCPLQEPRTLSRGPRQHRGRGECNRKIPAMVLGALRHRVSILEQGTSLARWIRHPAAQRGTGSQRGSELR